MLFRIIAAIALTAIDVAAQRSTGEIIVRVRDAAGAPLIAAVKIKSESLDVQRVTETTNEGRAGVRDLPLGLYAVAVEHEQFKTASRVVDLRSQIPEEVDFTLELRPVSTSVVVSEASTLLDPHATGSASHIGRNTIRDRRASGPGRAVLELVESSPGWLLEANGVLHPRGSEYNTQYVVDGIPIIDNRSPGFAPPVEVEDLESMSVMTAAYPAEYGRKLGGVIAVNTARQAEPGFHGRTNLQAGSFDTGSAYALAQFGSEKTSVSLNGQGGVTSRYLDPPVQQNFTNEGVLSNWGARLDHDLAAGRLRLNVQRRRTAFLVPNDAEQQLAGQRQDRRAVETVGQASYQAQLSATELFDGRVMSRDLGADLWSNASSTPILVFQDRGLRETYTNVSVTSARGRHVMKAGAEYIRGSVREQFRYRFSDPSVFDDDLPSAFEFAARSPSRETSAYIQDLIRAGNLTISLGLRWDRYRFLVRESAFSPRLALAWHLPSAGLVLRASYDRAFEVPPIENLLLANSTQAQHLSDESGGIAVPPSRAHFYQAGFSKTLGPRLRLDAHWFRRQIQNYSDDEVLLNTGVSFPIAFASARIHGFEARIEIPRWGQFSGFASFSNLSGTGRLPITGGLFVDEELAELLESDATFRITQDQRTTMQARLRWQAMPRLWTAFGFRYGSGLPTELGDDLDVDDVDARILERVDLGRGRLKPSWSVDVAAGVDLWVQERKALRVQSDITNMTDRLNVINFAGAFSGTAIGSPRAWAIRMNAEF